MTLETAYKYKPSGHDSPQDRRNYVKPSDELVEAFKEWLDKPFEYGRNMHQKATDLLADLEGMSLEEINSLPLLFENNPRTQDAGIFITVAYGNLETDELVYDAQVPIRFVGFQLKGKKLLIRSDTHRATGLESDSLIINYGKTVDFGHEAHGPVINFGSARDMTARATNISLNYGTIREFDIHRKAPAINMGTVQYEGGYINPDGQLKSYLEELKDQIGPHRSNEEIFAALRNRDIEQELTDILGETGK